MLDTSEGLRLIFTSTMLSPAETVPGSNTIEDVAFSEQSDRRMKLEIRTLVLFIGSSKVSARIATCRSRLYIASRGGVMSRTNIVTIVPFSTASFPLGVRASSVMMFATNVRYEFASLVAKSASLR